MANGLFSMPTPEAVRQEARDRLFKESASVAALPRGRGSVAAAGQAGGLFGQAISEAVGGVSPEEQRAQKLQGIQQRVAQEVDAMDLDLATPEGFIQISSLTADLLNQAGEPGLAQQAAAQGLQVRKQFLQDEGSIERDKLEQRKIEQKFREEQAEKKSEELSATVQKILDKAQTEAVDAGKNAASFDVLASDVEKADFEGGIIASISETMKNLTGTQDAVSDLRLKYNAVRASQAVTNLPPGPASDKDIALALSGFPKDNAPASQLARFLRGTAKLQRINEAFLTFKANEISEKKGTRRLLQKWKSKVNSPVLGRDVSISEIWITAANKGKTVQEVKDKLGIK